MITFLTIFCALYLWSIYDIIIKSKKHSHLKFDFTYSSPLLVGIFIIGTITAVGLIGVFIIIYLP